MPKIYCPDCGQANDFSATKPKFCGFCQSVLEVGGDVPASQTVGALKKKKKAAAGRKFVAQEEDEEEDTFDGTLPDIKKLDVTIDVPEIHRERVGDIWATGSTGDPVRENPAPKKVNREEALRRFRDGIYKKSQIDIN